MTYDLITGYDTITGHHTALYSTRKQKESCDNAVKMLKKKGVPKNKLLIGAAFYARIWENVAADNNGLRGHGKFLRSISYKNFAVLAKDSGFISHWDGKTGTYYLYNPDKKWFVTLDEGYSIALKTRYALKKGLNGIMFWQMADDSFSDWLLDIIDSVKNKF